jgi:soluble lytic murein transglycosylase-like protein
MIWLFGFGALIFFASQSDEVRNTVSDNIASRLESWNKFDALFQKWGSVYGVKWTWLKAIAMNESSLGQAVSVSEGLRNPSNVEGSKSTDGKSWGLMQVTLSTAKTLDPLATPQKLNDPNYSIKLAAEYVSKLQKMFPIVETRWNEWVIKSYNQGPGNTQKEMRGQVKGYAQAYWERWQRNLSRVEG